MDRIGQIVLTIYGQALMLSLSRRSGSFGLRDFRPEIRLLIYLFVPLKYP